MAPTRVVSVNYRANMAGYTTPLRAGTVATQQFARAAQQAGQQASTAMARTAQQVAVTSTAHMAAWQGQVTAGLQHSGQVAAQTAGQVAQSTAAWSQGMQGGALAVQQSVTGWQAQVTAGARATTTAVQGGAAAWSQSISGGAMVVGHSVAGWQAQVTAGALTTSRAVVQSTSAVQQGAAAAARSTATVSTASAAAARSIGASARSSEEAWSTAGAGMAAQGAVLAGGFLLAANAAMGFDKQMSAARAVLLPTADGFEALREAALAAGESTIFSASQAAQAITELGRAGISTEDILGGALDGALDLAAAGQLDLAEAAEVAADAMVMFGLKGSDVTHIADLLAAGANKSSTDVHQMGFALKQAGLLASQTGLSIEETTGALAMFASAGLKGSDAGTSLKVMLQMLNPKSDEAAGLMSQLGFSAFDAQGNFIGLTGLAQEMTEAFGNLTPEARASAMATIFGTDAVRAAAVMFKYGAEGTQEWISAVDDQGAAARTASMMTDNLAGDVEQLAGSLETALIRGGSGATAMLRDLVGALTAVVNWFNQLPAPLQSMIFLFAAVAGVILLFGGAALLAVPRIIAMRAAMQTLATTAPTVAASLRGVMLGLGVLGASLAVATTLVSVFGGSKRKSTSDVTSFTAAIKADSGAIGTNTRELATNELARLGALVAASKFGVAAEDLVDASLGDAAALQRVNEQLERSMQASLDAGDVTMDLAREYDNVKKSVAEVSDATALGAEQQRLAAEANRDGADSAKKLGDQSQVTADDLGEQATAAEQLKEALDALNGKQISTAEAAIAFQGSLRDLTDSVKENGRSLDINTEAGSANFSAFLDAAKGASAHAQAVADETNSVEAGNTVLQDHATQLRRVLEQMGFNRGQIDLLIAAYLRVPNQVSTNVSTSISQAIGAIGSVRAEIAAIPRNVTVTVTAQARVSQVATDVGSRIKGMLNADGAVYPPRSVRAYAEGAHVAQISRPGDIRIWGEPETQGEAYIPLAPSKRQRSTAILGDVAGRFGLDLVPQQGRRIPAMAAAGGGPPPAASPSGGRGDVTVNIAQLHANQQTAAAMATDLWWRMKNRGY